MMVRGLALLTGLFLSTGLFAGPAAAAPLNHIRGLENSSSSCEWIDAFANTSTPEGAIAEAFDALSDVCFSGVATDEDMITRAATALTAWIETDGTDAAAGHRATFYRALAAIEAEAELFAADGMAGHADPALMLQPLTPPGAEDAIFTLEEATVPFLGRGAPDEGTRVLIAIDAPGYQDLFTVHFPRGTAHLTLPAEDMIALAALAARDYDEAQIWVSPGPALTAELAFERAAAVQDILLQNDVPGDWIRVDDGGIDAILDRPERLSGGTDI